MTNGNAADAGSSRTALIRNAAKGGKWLIPAAALAAIALSLLRLDVTPEGWQSEKVCAAAEGLGRLVPDPVACIALASLMLIYWGARERQEAAALAATLTGWLTGIPGMAILARGTVKGAVYMFGTLKRKVHEQILADGRKQANAEWDAWLERRTSTGVFVPDDKDPPPSRTREED